MVQISFHEVQKECNVAAGLTKVWCRHPMTIVGTHLCVHIMPIPAQRSPTGTQSGNLSHG